MTETALKPFLTYEEQINNLVERKGMVISNRKYAFEKLEDISYFSLIIIYYFRYFFWFIVLFF